MNKIIEQLPELKLVGVTARTSNALEMDPATAKIGGMMQRFFMEELQAKILNRKDPGKVFAVYTEYESNEYGSYTYFLGEEVTSFAKKLEGFSNLIIPSAKYVKFTSDSGKRSKVVIDMWQSIWKMTPVDFGGQRTYLADFEIYDERSKDPNNTIVNIYINIK